MHFRKRMARDSSIRSWYLQSRTQEFESWGWGGRGDFRQMYRQDVSNVPTNIKEKSKLTKPRARETLNSIKK